MTDVLWAPINHDGPLGGCSADKDDAEDSSMFSLKVGSPASFDQMEKSDSGTVINQGDDVSSWA